MNAVVHYGHHLDLTYNELRHARFQSVAVLPPVDPARIGWVVFHEPGGRLYVLTAAGWELRATLADRATIATEAESAQLADEAVYAQQAGHATTATTAASATTADTATTAGHATTATNANHAATATEAYQSTTSNSLQGQSGAWYLDRANHTGTQPVSTLSDWTSALALVPLSLLGAPVEALDLGGQRLINGAPAQASTDVPTYGQVVDLVGGGGYVEMDVPAPVSGTSVTITHNLGRRPVPVAVMDNATGDAVLPGINYPDTDNVTLWFDVAPLAAQYRVGIG